VNVGRSTRAARRCLLLVAALCVLPAYASTTVIDDSGSLPYNSSLTLHWLPPVRAAGQPTVIGTTSVQVRLNVARWLHRSGRIYLVLPAQQPGALTASWSTQGRLLAGRLSSGSRTLVYSGPISAPFIEDVLQLTLNIDARQLQQLYQISFQFQMEQ
jgi:hypothetical protein